MEGPTHLPVEFYACDTCGHVWTQEKTDHHTPKKKEGDKDPKDWTTWTDDMLKAAKALAAAAEKKDAKAVKDAAYKLNNSCNNCHEVFRD